MDKQDKMNKRIGIFGGTFNPIHYGHLRAAEEVREIAGLEKIIFVPSCNPPLKDREVAISEMRYEMTRLAIEGNPFFDITDIECQRMGKSYTVETISELKRIMPDKDLFFILGIDSFLEIPQWFKPDKLMQMIDFIVVSRPGFKFKELYGTQGINDGEDIFEKLDVGLIDKKEIVINTGRKVILTNITPLNISATTIRKLVREGKSIKYLLPESVEYYIIFNRLYK